MEKRRHYGFCPPCSSSGGREVGIIRLSTKSLQFGERERERDGVTRDIAQRRSQELAKNVSNHFSVGEGHMMYPDIKHLRPHSQRFCDVAVTVKFFSKCDVAKSYRMGPLVEENERQVGCVNIAPVENSLLLPSLSVLRVPPMYSDRLKGWYVVARIFSCCCLTVLPGPAWLLLNKICIPFSRSLY